MDFLVGLKENVILGHLIPAGTGFRLHHLAEVKINLPEGYAESFQQSAELVEAGD